MTTVSLMDDIHRFTVDEYQRMLEAGALADTELIDGVLYDRHSDDVHRITVDEYERMARAGVLERTELIDGVVYDMASQYHLHGATTLQIYECLKAAFPDDVLCVADTVQLEGRTALDPDVMVVDGSVPFDQMQYIPAEVVMLVVEVSVTSQYKDLGAKVRQYAEAGIPQYWVVDPRPEVGRLLRHTRPTGGAYAEVQEYVVGEAAKGLDAAAVYAGET